MLILILLVGCKANNKVSNINLVGNYSSKSISKMEWVYYHYINKTMFSVGTTLVLNGDSTYTLTSCGNLIVGLWAVSNDSLLLFCKRNTWLNDSLNKVRPLNCGNGPQVFLVKDDGDLIDKYTIQFKGDLKSIPAATWLEKDKIK